MTIGIFRVLVLIALGLYLACVALPFTGWTVDLTAKMALAWYGAGASAGVLHPFVFVVLVAVRLAATIGLLLLFTWSRRLYAAWLLAGAVHAAFAGVNVAPAIDSAVGYVSLLLDGALLALAYSPPLAPAFRVDGAPKIQSS